MYARVKLFSIQRKIGDFHQEFYTQQIENYPNTAATTKYLENISLLKSDIKNLNPHQATLILG